MRTVLAGACAALGILAVSPASAACNFKVLPIPLTMVGARPTVPVMIGGRERHFLIDSGSFTNAISATLAADQNLLGTKKGRDGGVVGAAIISGAKGEKVTIPIVQVPELEFLGTEFKKVTFAVSSRIGGLDGLIGQPMLRQTDVEYDLRDRVIRLVKTSGCNGTDMVYWAKDGQAYSKMPIVPPNRFDPHTQGVIYINGQKMVAEFDTGASASFITATAAAKAGVKLTDAGVTRLGKVPGLDGDIDAWVGNFADVKIGDEVITNAPLEIGDSAASNFDVLIGADFFASHHVYVSNSQHQMYFAYDGGPAFRPPQAAKAAPVFGSPSTNSSRAKLPTPTCPPGEISLVCAGSPGGPATGTERPH